MKYYHTVQTHDKTFGRTISADNPFFSHCTVFEDDDKGIAVIKKTFYPAIKKVGYDGVNKNLATDIYLNENFKKFFEANAKPKKDGLYPVFELRKLMWALRMKPLKREEWEKIF